jgi:hypothetical protein
LFCSRHFWFSILNTALACHAYAEYGESGLTFFPLGAKIETLEIF